MSNRDIDVTVLLENLSGQEVDRQTISVPINGIQEYKFSDVPPGNYQTRIIPPEKYTVKPPNPSQAPWENGIVYGKVELTQSYIEKAENTPSDVIQKSELSKPPFKLIIISAVSISLLSNFGGAASLFRDILARIRSVEGVKSSTQHQSNATQTRLRKTENYYDDAFSPEVEERLRRCVVTAFSELSGIPRFAGLLASISWEREPEGEFERQLILLYRSTKKLEVAIQNCDPTLAPEILTAMERIGVSEEDEVVMVLGDIVNIRSGPSINDAILSQAEYGTVLMIDKQTFSSLTADQRIDIDRNSGWYPIFLPNGERGYIYSLYASRIDD
ncbi:MAG: SH3 domain-containing protein [Leptolyngbyaceae cyanobacterium]